MRHFRWSICLLFQGPITFEFLLYVITSFRSFLSSIVFWPPYVLHYGHECCLDQHFVFMLCHKFMTLLLFRKESTCLSIPVIIFFILVLIAYCNLKWIFLFPNLFLVARKLARKKPEDIKTIHFTLFGRRGKVISEFLWPIFVLFSFQN